jgi:hypothetical protein
MTGQIIPKNQLIPVLYVDFSGDRSLIAHVANLSKMPNWAQKAFIRPIFQGPILVAWEYEIQKER